MKLVKFGRKHFLVTIEIIVIIFVFQGDAQNIVTTKTFSREAINKINSITKPGDLIFRRIESGGSMFVLMTDLQPEYSHVGIVWKSENKTFVIHVTPSKDSSDKYVEIDSVEDYVQPASSTAIYRLRDNNYQIAQEAAKIGYELIGKISFDMNFDLTTDKQQYCTELIWKVYKEAGIDLVDSQFDIVHFAFLKTNQVIFVSTLLNSHWLAQVYP